MSNRDTRRLRLVESRKYLTKLLVIAAAIKYGLRITELNIGTVNQDQIVEATDLVKHGSIHIPKLLLNVNNLERFARYVVGWSNLSIATGILEIHGEIESGVFAVGLPEGRQITCIIIPSIIEGQFKELSADKAPDHDQR